MKLNIIIALLALILMIFILDAFIQTSEFYEGLSNNDKKQKQKQIQMQKQMLNAKNTTIELKLNNKGKVNILSCNCNEKHPKKK